MFTYFIAVLEILLKSVHFTKQFYGFRQQFPRKIAFMKCCCTSFCTEFSVCSENEEGNST